MGQNELSERVAKLETRVEALYSEHCECRAQVQSVAAMESVNDTSTKHAHKRIDDVREEFREALADFKSTVRWTLATSITIVGIFASILTWALGGR